MAKRINHEEEKKTVWRIFDKIEPISIFTLLILTIGGTHQVYSLLEIGIPYIRFFSASQLLSDSLVVITVFVSTVFLPFLSGVLLGKILYNIIKNKPVWFIKFSFFVGIILILVIGAVVEFYWAVHFLRIYGIYQLTIAISIGFLSVVMHYIYEENGLFSLTIKEVGRDYRILVFLFATLLFFIRKNFNNETFKIELRNFNNIHKIYRQERYDDNILYFNDNYIFVEIKKDSIYLDKQNPKKFWKSLLERLKS